MENIFNELKAGLEKNIEHTKDELRKIRAGKAQPDMLSSIFVEYYGNLTPLQQVANVSAPEVRTLMIQPWEKAIIGDIERAIINSNLGFSPQNDGESIRINIPPLTEERREELIKVAKAEVEDSKIGVRNLRKDANESLKKLQKEGTSEDAVKDAEGKVQKIVNEYISALDNLFAIKEKEMKSI